MLNNLFNKNSIKKAGMGILICSLALGGFSIYHHQAMAAEREQIMQAETSLLESQAAQQNITLIDNSQLQALAANAIGVNENDITDFRYHLIDLNNRPMDEARHGHYGWRDGDDRHHNFRNHPRNRGNCPGYNQNCPYPDQEINDDTSSPDNSLMMNNNLPPRQNTNVIAPVYRIACTANDVNYLISVDAQNGNIINCRVQHR